MSEVVPAKRYGGIIYVNAEKLEEYKKLHANVWPDVLNRLRESNIRNFTIYYCKSLGILVSHYEYIGSDYEKDMKAIGDDEVTRKWWKVFQYFLIMNVLSMPVSFGRHTCLPISTCAN